MLRNAVSKDKYRWTRGGYDLDLTYITDRIIAMGLPGESVNKLWRNDIDDVASFLKRYHRDRFLVFNLSGKSYDLEKFNHAVIDFAFPDHSTCKFRFLCRIVNSVDSWLKADSQNVAVIHCLAGRGRTGLVISCYLLLTGFCKTAEKSLEFFAKTRSSKGIGVVTPSQMRYVKYFETFLKIPPKEILPYKSDNPVEIESINLPTKKLTLLELRISGFIVPDPETGFCPVLIFCDLADPPNILFSSEPWGYTNEKYFLSSIFRAKFRQSPQEMATSYFEGNSTAQGNSTVRNSFLKRHSCSPGVEEQELCDYKFPVNLSLHEDVQVFLYHRALHHVSFVKTLSTSGYSKPEIVHATPEYPLILIFRFTFHTSFIDQVEKGVYKLRLRRNEVDSLFSGSGDRYASVLGREMKVLMTFADYQETPKRMRREEKQARKRMLKKKIVAIEKKIEEEMQHEEEAQKNKLDEETQEKILNERIERAKKSMLVRKASGYIVRNSSLMDEKVLDDGEMNMLDMKYPPIQPMKSCASYVLPWIGRNVGVQF